MNINQDKNEKQIRAEMDMLAKERVAFVKRAAANLFAASLIACADNQANLYSVLIQLQEEFFGQFANHVPINVEPFSKAVLERVEALWSQPSRLLIISNHPPFEKTASPTGDQLRQLLQERGRKDILDSLPNQLHLPAVISRRAVIQEALQKIMPDIHYHYHVVGASLSGSPLSIIQQADGSIIVPYGEIKGGFEMLQQGLERVFTNNQSIVSSGNNPVLTVVAFPEGGNPQTVDQLKPFRSGVFAASAQIVQESGTPISVLPMVMAVDRDFSVAVSVLAPEQITPELAGQEDARVFANQLRDKMNRKNNDLLLCMSHGHFWQGQSYPYGGPSRQKIQGLT